MATTTATPRFRSAATAEPRRLPRTTGALSALLIIALGAWGGLIPFVGPYFHYGFGSGHAWHYSANRLWLDIVPGAVAVFAGLMLFTSAHRPSGVFAGWLAVAAGAWFAIGTSVSLLWHHGGDPIGAPIGGYVRQMVEQLGFFYGLGVLIAALAAFAMGRFASRPHVAAEPVAAPTGGGAVGPTEAGSADLAAAEATRRPGRLGFFSRRRYARTRSGSQPD